jgi:outer membrane murein-binding lipoprotein Lpp
MFGIGGFNPVSLLATTAFGPAGGLIAQLASQVLSQAAQQLVQNMGDQMGLPQSAIDLAQSSVASRYGDIGGAAQNLNDSIERLGQETGASPSDIGSAQRDAADAIRYAAVEASQSEEAREARAGGKGGSWLLAMARALGAAADRKAEKLEAMSAGLDKAKPSETAEFQAETQEFNLLMSAMTSTIKTLGESMTTMAKRN